MDLAALVEAGLVVEVGEPGETPCYALSARGEDLPGSSMEPDSMWPVEPEPCPACQATDGYDGGARCLRCHVAWPPEM
jgi:hypothetical protein